VKVDEGCSKFSYDPMAVVKLIENKNREAICCMNVRRGGRERRQHADS
jgi:hypothetical protein